MSRVDAPLDVRLGGVAAGTWLAGLAALYLPLRLSLPLAGVALLGAAAAGVTGRRLGAARWIVAGVLLGIACGAAVTAARVTVRDAEPVAGLARERVRVQARLTVRDDPRPMSSSAGRAPTWLVPARLT